MICASRGSKNGSLKRRVQTHLARWKMKNCTPLWRDAHFQAKMYKTHQVVSTFGRWDVEKVRAVVAQSTFPSQNVQNTPGCEHFLKLRCRKSARRCGAKHISKSKCTKHTRLWALFEVEMSKKCTPLWRKAHFQVKMYKTQQVRTTFGSWDVEKVRAVVARSTFWSQKGFGALWYVRMSFCVAGIRDSPPCPKWAKRARFVAVPTTTTTTLHYISPHYTDYNYITLHYTDYITLHYATPQYTTPHHTTLH